jgi:hypothetical protein
LKIWRLQNSFWNFLGEYFLEFGNLTKEDGALQGKPKTWKIREHDTAAFPDNLIFAVYLNSRFVIYECRAEIADKDDNDCPEDWENRYGALIWKNIS